MTSFATSIHPSTTGIQFLNLVGFLIQALVLIATNEEEQTPEDGGLNRRKTISRQ